MTVVLLNVFVWTLLHLFVSRWAFVRARESFSPEAWLYRERRWEAGARFYVRVFFVKKWKAWLPDGAALLGNPFTKKSLQRRDRAYLEDFLRETCRGEWAHWTTMAFAPVFFLWNPFWADLVIVAYAFFSNLPCIVVQRYNRIVLSRILKDPSLR